MARLAIAGATGRTGRRLVAEALARGHAVRALARDPAALPARDGLTVVAGDVRDPAAVARLVQGTDGLLSALGGGTTAEPLDVRSAGMRQLVAACVALGVPRVVALGGGGVLDSSTAPGLRSEQPAFPAVFRRVSAEHRAAWECLRDSPLAWTYVCPPDIPDGEATGRYRVLADRMPDAPKALATGDLAAFMVAECTAGAFVRRRVGICT